MERVVLDGNRLRDPETAQVYLRRALALPEYYGGNLDALYDCLTEWGEGEFVVTPPEEETAYFLRVEKVFAAAAAQGGIHFRREEEPCGEETAAPAPEAEGEPETDPKIEME